MSDGLTLKIESCRDCPRLEETEARHWLLGNQPGYYLTCTKVDPPRDILPVEGIEPPPDWCPLRGEVEP